MTRVSLILRIIFALCLIGATCVHVATHLRFGVFLGALDGTGFPFFTRIYWSSLTIIDPLAAVLLFVRPRAGLVLATAVIVSDVVHNSWMLHHLQSGPDAMYWAQVAFLVFLLATVSTAWRGSPSLRS